MVLGQCCEHLSTVRTIGRVARNCAESAMVETQIGKFGMLSTEFWTEPFKEIDFPEFANKLTLMKSKLTLPSGATYCIDKNGNRVCTGSQMGRCNVLPENTRGPVKLQMQKLRLDSGGYDQWGAYWGRGPFSNIYCAWNGEEGCRVFVRAFTRQEAKTNVCISLPNARFYR